MEMSVVRFSVKRNLKIEVNVVVSECTVYSVLPYTHWVYSLVKFCAINFYIWSGGCFKFLTPNTQLIISYSKENLNINTGVPSTSLPFCLLPLPAFPSLHPSHSIRSRSPLFQLGVCIMGSAVGSLAGSRAKPQPSTPTKIDFGAFWP